MGKRSQKPKKLTYRLIEPESVAGLALYPLVGELVDAHHPELTDARIALAWNLSWQPDVDGRVTLGKCKKASELDRELAAFDFVIILRQEFFEDLRVTDLQRRALLDHELCHAAVKYDAHGEPMIDERGRTVYRTRKHDLEEFSDIAARYGCWKRDIEAFAQALSRAEQRSTGWVGYTALHEALKEIGLDVPAAVIATWPDDERREVLTWTLLRQSAGVQANAALSQTIPPCLAAAIASTEVSA